MKWRIGCFKSIPQEKILWLNIIVTMLSNFTDWKQWHHRQIKWRQQARKTSGEEQSFRGLGIWNKVICQHWCWGYLLKILLKWKQGTYEVPAIETGLLGELHPVLLQTHQKAADVKYQRSPPASWLWSGLKRSFEMNIMGTTNWNIIDLQIPIVNIAIEIYILYVCIMSANQILGIKALCLKNKPTLILGVDWVTKIV